MRFEHVERRRTPGPRVLGGELDATARETVSRDKPIRRAIARTDSHSLPWRYLICAQSCTVITQPIVVGWPVSKSASSLVLEER